MKFLWKFVHSERNSTENKMCVSMDCHNCCDFDSKKQFAIVNRNLFVQLSALELHRKPPVVLVSDD